MKGIESKVLLTTSDSRGSFRKTSVIPLALENTNITNPERRKLDKVICNGIVSDELGIQGIPVSRAVLKIRMIASVVGSTHDAANGRGLVNEGVVDRYVFKG